MKFKRTAFKYLFILFFILMALRGYSGNSLQYKALYDLSYSQPQLVIDSLLKEDPLLLPDSLQPFYYRALNSAYTTLNQHHKLLELSGHLVQQGKERNFDMLTGLGYWWMGNAYYYLKQKGDAIKYWKESVEYLNEEGSLPYLYQIYHNIGSVYLERHLLPESIRYLKSSIEGIEKLDGKTKVPLSQYRVLATAYGLNAEYELADSIFHWLRTESLLRGDTNLYVGVIAFHAGSYDHRKDYATSLKVVRPLKNYIGDTTQPDVTQVILSALIMAYKSNNKMDSAFYYQNILLELVKELNAKELTEEIARLETDFKTKEFQMANVLLQNENELKEADLQAEKARTAILFLVLLLLTIFIGGIWLYYRNLQKRRTAEKNEEIAATRIHSLEEGQKQERLRLSRELHDQLGAQLYNITLKLDTTHAKINRSPSVTIAENLAQIADRSRNAMAQLRDTIWSLHSGVISIEDFVGKVREYIRQQELEELYNTTFEVKGRGIESHFLVHHQRLNLLRIVQEGIQNIVKHAKANRVVIVFSVIDDNLNITISDNGIGFSTDLKGEGYGLNNIKQRVQELHGKVSWTKLAEGGTELSVSIPLQK